VVGVGVPAALAQTRLADGDPLLVGETHRRFPRLRGARSSNDESTGIMELLPWLNVSATNIEAED
jgi:hypothetical protein